VAYSPYERAGPLAGQVADRRGTGVRAAPGGDRNEGWLINPGAEPKGSIPQAD
jgi:hypothetical protein